MNGILVINKPLGYTSRDIVNKVGKILNIRKIGHTGTLDPNASGVLVLCIGKALKVCEMLQDHDKEYIAEVILGIETDTLDMDNNATIIKEENVDIDDDLIKESVTSFKGRYMQEVPIYSAIKVNGRKLYEYARNNIPVNLPKKEVDIKNISVIGDIIHKQNKIFFKIKCTVSKGTYIRSLIRDIGNKLNVPAVMNSLVRTRVGKFSIDNSYTLNDIENEKYHLIDITDALEDISTIVVDNDLAFRIKNGVILDKFFDYNMAFIKDKDNKLLAIYKNDGDKCRPYKMFI